MSVLKVVRSFDDVVKLIGRKLETIDETSKKVRSIQIDVGKLLIELRDRIGEVGELAEWWDWFEDNRMLFRNIERRTAQWYMQMAGAAEPERKQEELRRENTLAVREFRARALRNARDNEEKSNTSAVQVVKAAPKQPLPAEELAMIAQFIDLFRRMSDDGRVKALKEIDEVYRRWKEGDE